VANPGSRRAAIIATSVKYSRNRPRGALGDGMVDRDETRQPPSESDVDGEHARERGQELSRLISLSDGVFAFAMTLLIVSIDVPDLSDEEARVHLAEDVLRLWPQMLSYVIGFLVIGLLWGSHRRLFSRVRDYDDALTKRNIVLLMLVAFLPFPTGVLGQYGNLAFPAIFYAAIIAAISVVFILILDHLDRHRELMTRGGSDFDFPRAKARHLVTSAIFLLSMPVAWVLPGTGQLVWLLVAFNHRFTERLLPHLPGRFQERSHA
jgi:uncharacterized membrane protein